MNKDTIELERYKKHWEGSGIMFNPFSHNPDELMVVLDKLVEWGKNNEGKKIYRHKVWETNEDMGDGLAYDSKNRKWTNRIENNWSPSPHYDCDIKFVDLVYYLDIYWQ